MELFTAYMMLWQIAVIYDSNLGIEHTQTSAGINIENKIPMLYLDSTCSAPYVLGIISMGLCQKDVTPVH